MNSICLSKKQDIVLCTEGIGLQIGRKKLRPFGSLHVHRDQKMNLIVYFYEHESAKQTALLQRWRWLPVARRAPAAAVCRRMGRGPGLLGICLQRAGRGGLQGAQPRSRRAHSTPSSITCTRAAGEEVEAPGAFLRLGAEVL